MNNKNDNKNEKPSEENKNAKEEPVNNENPELNESEVKIAELEKEVQDLKDKVLRRAAEFENYKRRTENDQLNLLKYAAENFIIKLLPVVDDFERSLLHLNNAADLDKIKEGIQLVYEKFIKTLDEQGVKKIESEGKPFNVNFHEAIMQRPDDSVPPHTVLNEVEAGYMYKDRVIRHAKVIVSEDTEA